MSDGELFVGLISVVVAMITWTPWYGDILLINRLAAPRPHRLVLGLMPLACLLLVLLCLGRRSASAVPHNPLYILLYMFIGAAVLGVSAQLFSLLGMSARDDILERRNNSSLIAISGALLGVTLCFADSNIGEGRGIAAVLASAATALSSWFVLWLVAEHFSGGVIAERITVERDPGSGVRLAGLLTANALILRAAAAGGSWISIEFLHDFAITAWPALTLTAIAILVERITKPLSSLGQSILLVIVYLLVAVIWMVHLGLRV